MALNFTNVAGTQAHTVGQLFLSPFAGFPHLAHSYGYCFREIVHSASKAL